MKFLIEKGLRSESPALKRLAAAVQLRPTIISHDFNTITCCIVSPLSFRFWSAAWLRFAMRIARTGLFALLAQHEISMRGELIRVSFRLWPTVRR
jgi:hypothetical protein